MTAPSPFIRDIHFWDPKIEIASKVPGYRNYLVTTHGRIKNIEKNKYLKGSPGKNGHLHVSLCNASGKPWNTTIHHVMALAFLPKIEEKTCVDHVDGDPSNNTIVNLRWRTPSENGANRGSAKNSTSQFKGVSYYKTTGKWQSQIKFNKKNLHLGYYSTEKDAATAYDLVAGLLFKEFAKKNFPADRATTETIDHLVSVLQKLSAKLKNK